MFMEQTEWLQRREDRAGARDGVRAVREAANPGRGPDRKEFP